MVRFGWVFAATDWDGMTKWDQPFAALVLANDLSNFAMIPARCHQGVLNALLLMKLVSSDAFVNDKHLVFNGKPVIDPTKRFFYGESLVFSCRFHAFIRRAESWEVST